MADVGTRTDSGRDALGPRTTLRIRSAVHFGLAVVGYSTAIVAGIWLVVRGTHTTLATDKCPKCDHLWLNHRGGCQGFSGDFKRFFCNCQEKEPTRV